MAQTTDKDNKTSTDSNGIIQIVMSSNIHNGLKVTDEDGVIGEVKQCDDLHNIWVVYDNGGSGFYCLDENCKDYDKLYYS